MSLPPAADDKDAADNLLHKMPVFDIVIALSAPCPSGKGEVCKTFIHQFDSDRRLLF